MLTETVGSIQVCAYKDDTGMRRVALVQDSRTLFDRAVPNQTMTLEELLQVHVYKVCKSLERLNRALGRI